LDKNIPFYIGIGTKFLNAKKYETEYKRAHDKSMSRNRFWKSVVNKTDYLIEILFESENYDKILIKEQEFIKLYGRSNNGTGILTNLTDGGEGTFGLVVSDKTKELLRQNSGQRGNTGYKSHLSKEIFIYDLLGNFVKSVGSMTCLKREYDINIACVLNCLNGTMRQTKGFMLFDSFKGQRIEPLSNPVKKWNIKRTVIISNGDEILKFDSVTNVAKFLNVDISTISKACRKSFKVKGFICKYDKQN